MIEKSIHRAAYKLAAKTLRKANNAAQALSNYLFNAHTYLAARGFTWFLMAKDFDRAAANIGLNIAVQRSKAAKEQLEAAADRFGAEMDAIRQIPTPTLKELP